MVRERGLDGVDAGFVMPPSLPRRLNEEGLGCAVWTVNTVPMAIDLVLAGVPIITTDRLPLIRDGLRAAGFDAR